MANINLALLSTVEQRAAEAAAQALSRYSDAIQAHLEAKARERHYDSIQSAVSYRGDPNAQFAAEAEALFVWRSAVWSYATAELGKVTAGERAQPGIEEFVGGLPAFVWPEAELRSVAGIADAVAGMIELRAALESADFREFTA